MCVVTLVCLGFRRAGILTNSINIEHYHDLGKWLFALTAFYTYIAFSQYLLIWYANIPEETIFYRARSQGGWLSISLALPFLRFFIPFFVLLCRAGQAQPDDHRDGRGLEPGDGIHGYLLGGDAGALSQRSADSLAGFRHARRPRSVSAGCSSGTASGSTRWCRWAICASSRACILRTREASMSEHESSHQDPTTSTSTDSHSPRPQRGLRPQRAATLRTIWAFTVGSVIILVVVIVALQQYFEKIWNDAVYEKVLAAPSQELQDLRNRDDWALTHYRIQDKSQGQVRIPLEQRAGVVPEGRGRGQDVLSGETHAAQE